MPCGLNLPLATQIAMSYDPPPPVLRLGINWDMVKWYGLEKALSEGWVVVGDYIEYELHKT